MHHNPMTKPAAVGGLMDRLLARADNCNLWSSLQPMHDATGGAIITLMVSAEEIYNNILAVAGEHKLATSIYGTCVKDMNQAVSEVEAIHGQWSHRSGFAASQQDLALMAEISDQYRICNERFQQLAVQNVMELTTILAELAGGNVQAIDAEGNPIAVAGQAEETVTPDEGIQEVPQHLPKVYLFAERGATDEFTERDVGSESQSKLDQWCESVDATIAKEAAVEAPTEVNAAE